MKLKPTYLTAAVLALSFAVSGARADDGRSDAWITTKVKAELATHKNVSAIATKVKTNDGVVTLRGKVGSTAEKELAESYVKQVEGVKSVDNQLVVQEKGSYKHGGDRGTENRTTGASDDRGAGDKVVDEVKDGSLTARVKTALMADPGTSAFHTEVDSNNGNVILSGTAKTEAEKEQAERTVRGVSGVTGVENRIEVP
jgi:hyperosmotically inducible protein